MSPTKILFAADLHGNESQYKKIFEKAISEKVNSIIFGGDLSPKDSKHRTIEDQKEFFEKTLFPSIEKFHKENENKCKIYLILGNDDLKANQKFLEKNESKGFKIIHNKCVKFNEEVDIIGYSYVPITPFVFKDWEQPDSNLIHESEYRTGFTTEGIETSTGKIKKTKIDLNDRKETIENNLNKLFDETNKKLILVTHTPPYDCSLDIISSKEHVGSIGVRNIIEQRKPIISLHGHIHETFEMSGKFIEKIGETYSMTPSNDHLTKTVKIILIDLEQPENAKRETI